MKPTLIQAFVALQEIKKLSQLINDRRESESIQDCLEVLDRFFDNTFENQQPNQPGEVAGVGVTPEYREISYSEFEVDLDMPSYLRTSTADAWYDILGTFFIYSVMDDELVTILEIPHNGEKYEEIAKFLYAHLMRSDEFLVLSPLDEGSSFYHYTNGELRLISAQKKYDEEEVQFRLAMRAKCDIEETIESAPSGDSFFDDFGLTPCNGDDSCVLYESSRRDFDEFDYYVFDTKTKKLWHAPSMDPYESSDQEIDRRIKSGKIVRVTERFSALNLLRYSVIYQTSPSEKKISKLIS